MGEEEKTDDRQIHVPVLLERVLEILPLGFLHNQPETRPQELFRGEASERATGKRILDGTVGLGGHAEAILSRLGSGGILVGIDQDAEALEMARSRLEKCCPLAARFHLFQGFFTQAQEALLAAGIVPEGGLDGILLDLGVSSYQLDTARRGFSFLRDGPLDMRLSGEIAGEGSPTAAKWLESASFREIEQVLREFGEEPAAGKIARAIDAERRIRPLRSTLQLARLVESVKPRWREKIHPATRSFQAIRIKINAELEQLRSFLWLADRFLAPGGRLVVISYHSLEDRLVKQLIHQRVKEGIFDKPRPEIFRPLKEEIERNPRCRSARLRWASRSG